MHAPSQWQTTLQRNVVSHWLGACTEWFLWLQIQFTTFGILTVFLNHFYTIYLLHIAFIFDIWHHSFVAATLITYEWDLNASKPWPVALIIYFNPVYTIETSITFSLKHSQYPITRLYSRYVGYHFRNHDHLSSLFCLHDCFIWYRLLIRFHSV